MKNLTPKPWRVSLETTRGEFVTETRIRAADDSVLATVGPCNIEANAPLFAAAPELLAALEVAADWLSRSARIDDREQAEDARIAIAKAKGQPSPG